LAGSFPTRVAHSGKRSFALLPIRFTAQRAALCPNRAGTQEAILRVVSADNVELGRRLFRAFNATM
jgi:hypothetical protein